MISLNCQKSDSKVDLLKSIVIVSVNIETQTIVEDIITQTSIGIDLIDKVEEGVEVTAIQTNQLIRVKKSSRGEKDTAKENEERKIEPTKDTNEGKEKEKEDVKWKGPSLGQDLDLRQVVLKVTQNTDKVTKGVKMKEREIMRKS